MSLAPPLTATRFPTLTRVSHRQSPRRLRSRQLAAHRRHRPHLRIRLRAGIGHPRQGQGADAVVGVLVRSAEGRHPESLRQHSRRRVSGRGAAARRRPRGARRCSCARPRRSQIECVARGYLSGSGWKEYQQTGTVCGIALPKGLRESDRLPTPIFTPATKASTGHDNNIPEAEAARILGDAALVTRLRETTLELYRQASAHAESKGIILADTKFEFGLDGAELLLIDEALTPDSSRFWPADQYAPGRPATELRQAVRARLPGSHQVEQAAAGAVAAGRCGDEDPREVPGGVRAPHRSRAGLVQTEVAYSYVHRTGASAARRIVAQASGLPRSP